jgi:hypothetical protein
MRRFPLAILVVYLSGAMSWAQPAESERGPSSDRLVLKTGELDTRREPNLLLDPNAEFAETGWVMLQLKGPITSAQRTQLKKLGVVLFEYVPDHAYIADVRRVSREELTAISFVQWVGRYRREWKCSPQIGRRIAPFESDERIRLAESDQVRLVVTLFENENPQPAIDALQKAGASILGRDRIAHGVVIFVDIAQDRVASLSDIDSIQFVEEAPELTLRNDTTSWIVQSNQSGAYPFYGNGIHGENQIIGVMDGQPDKDHCSLDNGKFLFYNSSDGNSFHGTHVACTAAGNDTSGANRRGVAYAANMVFDTVPSFTETGVTTKLNLHHTQGARIHTNSWGDDGTTAYNGLCRGFDDFLYQNEDDFACLAVTNGSQLRNPENAKNLLAVGASHDTPSQHLHCSGGTGPTADGRRKPEIYAPGCSTISAVPSACSVQPNTGTSMACPAVAGTAALVRQYFVDGYYPSGVATVDDAFAPSGALIKSVLINSAVDMTGIGGYPSNLEGWGRLLADNAVYFPGDVRNLEVLDDVRNASGLATGESGEYAVTVLGTGVQLRVTLVWTDPPAAATTGSGLALVNNLDLEVVSPVGQVYHGNFFANGVSLPNGTPDSLNNVEQVHVSTPTIGEWVVRVKGTAVNQGTQGYALIATGEVAPEPPDCNTNGIPDFEDVDGGGSLDCDSDGTPDECQPQDDCNTNGVQDICDIAGGFSDDCSGNGVPDECESDCNGNDVADSCDIIGPTSSDCNANDLPDECETDCNGNGIPDDCDVAAGEPDCNENGLIDACELTGALGHDCCAGGSGTGCSDESIEACVCATDPYCCDVNWDGICAFRVEQYQCSVCTVATDCDTNGVPDDCESDCNFNGIVDACDISGATSTDCNVNTIPDECESPDCNGNGVLDECDLAGGTSTDCNENLVPDDCEIEFVGPGDCCEIEHGAGCLNPTIQACVCEDAPSCCEDEWDETCVTLVEQFGCGVCDAQIDPDCDGSGVLDTCEDHDDCNANGVPDVCDEPDCNENDIPDECETVGLIVGEPVSTTVCPGATAQLSVDAPGGTAFQWLKEGAPLVNGPNISGATTSNLAIVNVGAAAVGLYSCVVSVGCVTLESESAAVALHADPTIDVQPPATESSCTNTTVIVVIEASGFQLGYRWFKDDIPLTNGGKFSGVTTATLTISNLDVADEADEPGYRCVVTDGCGRSVETDPMTLAIVGPVFTLQPIDQCVEIGEVAVFTATAVSPVGFTQFTQWFKNGNPLVDTSRVTGAFTDTLTIDLAEGSDVASYEMRALTIGPNCAQFSNPAELSLGDCCLSAGDMDNDGDYDLYDMHLFTICFGKNRTSGPGCACADIDGIGDVIDIDDWTSLSGLIDGP